MLDTGAPSPSSIGHDAAVQAELKHYRQQVESLESMLHEARRETRHVKQQLSVLQDSQPASSTSAREAALTNEIDRLSLQLNGYRALVRTSPGAIKSKGSRSAELSLQKQVEILSARLQASEAHQAVDLEIINSSRSSHASLLDAEALENSFSELNEYIANLEGSANSPSTNDVAAWGLPRQPSRGQGTLGCGHL